MADWWERLGPNYESGQEKQSKHNEGEKDGSQATWSEKFAHRVGGGTGNEHYDKGWKNGANHQPKK